MKIIIIIYTYNVEINKDTAESLGRNIGIAGTVAGVYGAVAKGIAKSSLPVLQKAGVIIGAGAAGGAIFLGTSVLNRVANSKFVSTSSGNSTIDNLPDNVNKLFDNGNSLSDLMFLILSMNILVSVCLTMTFILFMIILLKFYLNEDNVNLNKINIKINMNTNNILNKKYI